MILESLSLSSAELQERSGWAIRPEGACKGDRCVPLPDLGPGGDRVDLQVLAERLGMPIVHDAAHGLYAVGPESGGRVLESAACPDLRLPDLDGKEFAFSSLRGRKVVMVAWATW